MKIKRILALALGAVTAFSAFGAVTVSAEELPQVPQIRIDTENAVGQTLQKADGYVNAGFTLTDTDGATLSEPVSFKVRGNTTAMTWVKKKAFTFKFAKKRELLDMGKGKKWVLLANTFDSTFVRNFAAFDTAKELGLDYTSEQKITELWLDGKYWGCYTLMEPVQSGKDRVDIDTDHGDFMFELETMNTEEGETYFGSGAFRFVVNEPEEPDDETLQTMSDSVTAVIKAMKSYDEDKIRELIDVPSFAKYYVLNEFLKTFDFSVTSVKFYQKDGVIYAGPAWDYDLSAGNNDPAYSQRAKDAYDPEGLFCDNKHFYYYLTRCDWFNAEVQRVYNEHRAWFENLGADGGYADTFRATYADVIDRNYKDAGWNVGKWWLNNQLKPAPTYEQNFQRVKTWYQKRAAWLGEYFDAEVFYQMGDTNGDGVIDVNDATATQRLIAEDAADLDEYAPVRALTGDKTLSVGDATAVQRYVAGEQSATVGKTKQLKVG